MENINQDRADKFLRVIEEYEKRKTQKEIADMFDMNIEHVSWVTQAKNNSHTRKITPENIRPGEKINPFVDLNDFEFLDKYPLKNFEK